VRFAIVSELALAKGRDARVTPALARPDVEFAQAAVASFVGPPPVAAAAAIAQKQAGRLTASALAPKGALATHAARGLADAAVRFGDGVVYLTPDQNAELHDVAEAAVADAPVTGFVCSFLPWADSARIDQDVYCYRHRFRVSPVVDDSGNPEIALSRNEVLTDRTDIIGTAILGLTVGCARCHNHKLEPIAQTADQVREPLALPAVGAGVLIASRARSWASAWSA